MRSVPLRQSWKQFPVYQYSNRIYSGSFFVRLPNNGGSIWQQSQQRTTWNQIFVVTWHCNWEFAFFFEHNYRSVFMLQANSMWRPAVWYRFSIRKYLFVSQMQSIVIKCQKRTSFTAIDAFAHYFYVNFWQWTWQKSVFCYRILWNKRNQAIQMLVKERMRAGPKQRVM